MFNLNIASGQQRPAERLAPQQDEVALATLRRAARKAHAPPTDTEIVRLETFLRQCGERPEAVVDIHGALEREAVKRFVENRKGARA